MSPDFALKRNRPVPLIDDAEFETTYRSRVSEHVTLRLPGSLAVTRTARIPAGWLATYSRLTISAKFPMGVGQLHTYTESRCKCS